MDDIDQHLLTLKNQLIKLGIAKENIYKGEKFEYCAHAHLQYQKCSAKECQERQIYGTIILTNFKIIFETIDKLNYKRSKLRPEYFSVYFPVIRQVCKKKVNENNYEITIVTKEYRFMKLLFNGQEISKIADELYQRLNQKIFEEEKYTFLFGKYYNLGKNSAQWWELYDVEKEFERQKLNISSDFQILENSQGQICPSYPIKLMIPKQISETQLKKCIEFRSKKRIPVVTFSYIKEISHQRVQSILFRCSQCNSGFTQRCLEDEQIFQIMAQFNQTKGSFYENRLNQIKFCEFLMQDHEKMPLLINLKGKDLKIKSIIQHANQNFLIFLILIKQEILTKK